MTHTALGVYAGIGAMLIPTIGDSQWNVLGNIESRKIYLHEDEEGRNTFTENFSRPFFAPQDEPAPHMGLTLVAAQPKCGGFSSLYGTGRKATDTTSAVGKYGDGVVEAMRCIHRHSPRVFFLENLAKSLTILPADLWHAELPEYDIQFHWVSNYGYGNPQKGRNRLYVVGSKKGEGFRFVPREDSPGTTVSSAIGDLGTNWGAVANHDKHSRKDKDNLCNLAKDTTWKSIAKYVREECKYGENLPYLAKDGTVKRRIGSNKLHLDKHSHTLAGIKGAKFHPVHGYPISLRERCRLQGYPDSFKIWGTKFQEDEPLCWSLRKNPNVVRQLNNTVPLQFPVEFFRQLNFFLETGSNLYNKGDSINHIKPNELVTEANLRMEEITNG